MSSRAAIKITYTRKAMDFVDFGRSSSAKSIHSASSSSLSRSSSAFSSFSPSCFSVRLCCFLLCTHIDRTLSSPFFVLTLESFSAPESIVAKQRKNETSVHPMATAPQPIFSSSTADIELDQVGVQSTHSHATSIGAHGDDDPLNNPSGRKVVEALDSYPDGGWTAWLQVFYCFWLFFVPVGSVYSWGIMQKNLVEAGISSASSLSFVGSTQAVMQAVLGIPISRCVGAFGPRKVAIAGAVCCLVAPIIAAEVTHSLVGLLLTQGVLFGLGQGLCFHAVATLPSTYFLRKRHLATGLVYAGGGVGGGVLTLLSSWLIGRVGREWCFRILGIAFGLITLPCSFAIKSRLPLKPMRSGAPIVDWTLFRDKRFTLMILATSIALFPLFVPPFFLPLFATAIGLSTSTSSALLAGFNFASAAGRILFGLGADQLLGSVNSLLCCLLFAGISTLAIWPWAESLPLLIVFAIVNGISSGGFFSLIAGVISSLFGSSTLGVTFGMLVSAWAPGYFLGAPVGGYLLDAYGGAGAGFEAFRPAIFYSGALSLVAAGLVMGIRVIESRKVFKRV